MLSTWFRRTLLCREGKNIGILQRYKTTENSGAKENSIPSSRGINIPILMGDLNAKVG